MRKGDRSMPPFRLIIESESTRISRANPKMWVQLEGEHKIPTIILLEIVQQLRTKMAHLWADNEWLIQDQEKILKNPL